MTNPLSLHKGSANAAPIATPTAKQVNDFHRNADTNRRPESIHHSLGGSHNQAAYGDHTHNGSDSQALVPNDLTGTFSQNLGTLQGIKNAIKQVIQLLTAVGATDSTTVNGNYPVSQGGQVNCTWTAAGTTSDTITVNFPVAFAVAPRIAMYLRTSTTAVIALYIQATPSTGSFTFRAVASVSQAASSTIPVEWLAVASVPFS